MVRIYNSLSGEKENLPPPTEQKKIRLFVCGPTVYDYLHIGNARTYIFFDFFAKYLRSQGYEVTYVQNITDIDDKIIKRAAEKNKKPEEVAKHFAEAYLEDMKSLGVDAVTHYAPATKFITQIVAQVQRLIDKGFAYEIDGDGWYFDISKDEDYGKLSHRTIEQAEDATSRIDEAADKRNKGDFCLWKFSKDGEPSWTTTLGVGRPGWHIEDTAISEFYFGPQYEIHGGGVDLKFPHHEAEIAQQESASGLKPFVQIWMHTGALLVDSKKMSKSLGNFITIRDFLKKYPPEVLRWITLTHDYRSPIDFSEELTEQAKNELQSLYEIVNNLAIHMENSPEDKLGVTRSQIPELGKRFFEALEDNLNISKAFSIFWEIGALTAPSKERLEFIKKVDSLFNLGLAKIAMAYSAEKDPKINAKKRQYDEFRANKQFTHSDALRKEIESLGYIVRDTAEGSYIVKKFF